MSRRKPYKQGYHHPVENDEIAARPSTLDAEDKARRARAYMRIRRQQEEARKNFLKG